MNQIPTTTKRPLKRAFTIVEILVVVSIIAMLAGFLIIAIGGGHSAANSAKVKVKLKDINSWMQLWSGEHNNQILPSQFDYAVEASLGTTVQYRDKPAVRSLEEDDDDNPYDNIIRNAYEGTWTDILWTDNNLVVELGYQSFDFNRTEVEIVYGDRDALLDIWRTDSPDIYPEDTFLYELYQDYENPFRSTVANTRGPAKDLPGYFAANDFFDARSEVDSQIDGDGDGDIDSTIDRYYTYAMMHAPARSIYLVDSVAGETILPDKDSWDARINTGGQPQTADMEPLGDIDFRYGEECMFLLLDGSVKSVTPWTERGPDSATETGALTLLGRGYRVHDLTLRKPTE